jgi:hypothetical protein
MSNVVGDYLMTECPICQPIIRLWAIEKSTVHIAQQTI